MAVNTGVNPLTGEGENVPPGGGYGKFGKWIQGSGLIETQNEADASRDYTGDIATRDERDASGQSTYMEGKDYLNPETSTMQGQLKGLLSNENELHQMYQSKAQQQAQSSGLQNSLMASTAGTAAWANSVMPIAKHDADTYAALDMLDANYDIQNDFTNKKQKFEMQALDKNLSLDERQMMTSAFAGMFNTALSDVTRIMSDDTLGADGKRNMINELWSNYQDTVETLSDLNEYDYVW